MVILFVVLALALAGLSGTLLAVLRDGYRPTPIDLTRLSAPAPVPSSSPKRDGRSLPRALPRSMPVSPAR